MTESRPIICPPQLEPELIALIRQGMHVSAVKRLCEVTGCGLAAGKAWLDNLLATRLDEILNRPAAGSDTP